MTDLARLLDETPTEGELLDPNAESAGGAQWWMYTEQERADLRVSLVLATAEACAKLVCIHCRTNRPVVFLWADDPDPDPDEVDSLRSRCRLWIANHQENGEEYADCAAEPIWTELHKQTLAAQDEK